MKKVLTFIFVILIVNNLYAQVVASEKIPFPATYVITTDTITSNISLPDSCWQMIADPSGKMTLEQVLQPEAFKDTTRKDNYQSEVFWYRYRIANNMQKDAKITLNLREVSRTDLYIKKGDGEWNHLKTGYEVPWSQRDGLKRLINLNAVIPPGGEITVYERVKKHSFLFDYDGEAGVRIAFTETVVKKNYVENDSHIISVIENSFATGLLVLAFLINLYFFVVVREKEFLYYALYLLASAINNIGPFEDFVFKDAPRLTQALIYITSYPLFLLLIFFIRYFFKTFLFFPKWDKWLIALAYAQVVIGFMGFHLPFLLHENLWVPAAFMLQVPVTITSASLLITFMLRIRSYDRATRITVIAVLPSILFWLIGSLIQFNYYLGLYGFGVKTNNSFITFFTDEVITLLNLSSIWMVVVFSWVLIIRFSSLRKKVAMQEVEKEKERSALIAQQKIELEKQVAERTSELKQSLEDLKSTQKQLIQSEKMASLGELTAGIAHEIQNPLNFVNNFSDINSELVDELKSDLANGNIQDANEIADDIKENSQKISHHGKRADSIVKGMLQHSRTSTGQKEPTDINALCDEYLRLAYHGMRAKDKSFNCEMKTEFDSSLPKINVVPQDIGRVILNLINNAFYACAERKNLEGFQNLQGLAPYLPTVTVNTENLGDKVEISVKDNGNGIPEKIKDKIFQPFFTTKPTGQGTGLGLSLSYDIIKAHGGEIKVRSLADSKNGYDGTEFIVTLPF